MDNVRSSIRTLRSTLPLRSIDATVNLIKQRLRILETNNELSPIEKYATAVGRKALHDLSLVRNEVDGIEMIIRWTRMSLAESVDEKRSVVTQVGSVLLATDFKGHS